MNALQKRFDEKWIPEPNSGCWLWTATENGNGYGRIWAFGSLQVAHRVSWILRNGEIPIIDGIDIRGTCVLHRCDNTFCVNPDHLFLGTHQDNMQDKMNKGRHVSNAPKGDECPSSKLTSEQVLLVRRFTVLRGAARWSHGLIGKMFGVNRSTISVISRGDTWKSILPEEE